MIRQRGAGLVRRPFLLSAGYVSGVNISSGRSVSETVASLTVDRAKASGSLAYIRTANSFPVSVSSVVRIP